MTQAEKIERLEAEVRTLLARIQHLEAQPRVVQYVTYPTYPTPRIPSSPSWQAPTIVPHTAPPYTINTGGQANSSAGKTPGQTW